MRLAFASDFHGSRGHFFGFLELARQEKVAAAIVGGDLFPSARPYDEMLRGQQRFATTVVPELLHDHTSQQGCPVYLTPGNNDLRGAIQALAGVQQEGLVVIPAPAVHSLVDGYAVVVLPYVQPAPFLRLKDFERRDLAADPAPDQPNPIFYSTGDEVLQGEVHSYLSQRPSIQEELDELRLGELDAGKTVYVMHSPPFRTGLDRTGSGLDAGSRAIRAAIERYQPVLTLHGHIHEAPVVSSTFACRLVRTVCINCGQTPERLHAAIIEVGPPIRLRHTCFGSLDEAEVRLVG